MQIAIPRFAANSRPQSLPPLLLRERMLYRIQLFDSTAAAYPLEDSPVSKTGKAHWLTRIKPAWQALIRTPGWHVFPCAYGEPKPTVTLLTATPATRDAFQQRMAQGAATLMTMQDHGSGINAQLGTLVNVFATHPGPPEQTLAEFHAILHRIKAFSGGEPGRAILEDSNWQALREDLTPDEIQAAGRSKVCQNAFKRWESLKKHVERFRPGVKAGSLIPGSDNALTPMEAFWQLTLLNAAKRYLFPKTTPPLGDISRTMMAAGDYALAPFAMGKVELLLDRQNGLQLRQLSHPGDVKPFDHY